MDELEIAARKLCEIRGVDPDAKRFDHSAPIIGDGQKYQWEFLLYEIKEEKRKRKVREALGYEKTN